MKPNDGKYLEHLVKLIEKSLDPSATVKHDVKMPILKSPSGLTAQCDIVIWQGKPPRETITIIEVQDRNRPVEINDFRGWKQKLKDVGAQHLICVSNHEFPPSIKEQVDLSGNTIRLIRIDTLKDINGFPINLFNTKFSINDFLITSYDKVRLSNSKKFIKIDKDFKCLSYDKINLFSLEKLCYDSFRPDGEARKGNSKLKFTSNTNNKLYYHYPQKIIEVDLEVIINWQIDIINVPVKTLTYEQNEFGVLAWVIEIYHIRRNKIIDIKIPVTKSKTDNLFEISQLFFNIPLGTELKIAVKKKNN